MEGQMLKHLVTGQKSSNFQHPLRTTLFPFFQQKKLPSFHSHNNYAQVKLSLQHMTTIFAAISS